MKTDKEMQDEYARPVPPLHETIPDEDERMLLELARGRKPVTEKEKRIAAQIKAIEDAGGMISIPTAGLF